MLKLKGEFVKLLKWDLKADVKWGKMYFELPSGVFKPVENKNLRVYNKGQSSILEVDTYILNTVEEDLLFGSSLVSICKSVLDSIQSDLLVKASNNDEGYKETYIPTSYVAPTPVYEEDIDTSYVDNDYEDSYYDEDEDDNDSLVVEDNAYDDYIDDEDDEDDDDFF